MRRSSLSSMSSRKDDPVFNVKFVQLVETHPCLWNSTLPAYSKKEEIQKAWQEVANETKDTVRNCRERWRTIRSSFLRSLKLSRTTTGRGKRKYYLSKYLQFLIPFTKTRLKNGVNIVALRKAHSAAVANVNASAAAATACQLPMTRISHMPLPIVSSDDTKDSTTSEVAIAEEDVVVSLHEGRGASHQQQQQQHQLRHLRLLPLAATIKTELGASMSGPLVSPTPAAGQCGASATIAASNGFVTEPTPQQTPVPPSMTRTSSTGVDLTEFAEWIKSKNDHHRHCLMPSSPDADQSFLNSLHPFLKEMSGKQNRRFRQKVVALIDVILDNAD